jgi:transcriptional regulator with XRE-family HTH domain
MTGALARVRGAQAGCLPAVDGAGRRADGTAGGLAMVGAREPMTLGTQVRLWRTARRLTAHALAARCGVSRSLISQIETDRTSPSLDVVRRLAAALEVPIAALFAPVAPLPPADGNGPLHVLTAAPPAPARRPALVRRDERKGLRLPKSRVTYELLSPDLKGRLQVQWVELAPGERGPEDGFVHPGEECYVVLQGRVRFRVGDEEFMLGPGDALTFDSAVPHSASNDGPQTAIAISCMTPPSF